MSSNINKPFSVINEDRLDQECFLIRRMLKCGTDHYNDVVKAPLNEPDKNKIPRRQQKTNETPIRSHSPPVRDSSKNPVKNVLAELLDKMANKLYVLTEFIQNADRFAKNASTLLAFSDVNVSVKQARLSNYITRIQIKLFGLFQQFDNIESTAKDYDMANLIIIVRGATRLLDELSSALEANYIGGPFDRRMEKIPILCRRIVEYSGQIPILTYDNSNDVKIIDLLENLLKFRSSNLPRNKISVNRMKTQPKRSIKKLNFYKNNERQVKPYTPEKAEITKKEVATMVHFLDVEDQFEKPKLSSEIGLETKPETKLKINNSTIPNKGDVVKALSRLKLSSDAIKQRWGLMKESINIPQEMEYLPFKRKQKPVLQPPKVVMADPSTATSMMDYKIEFEHYLKSINHWAINRNISPWSITERICTKIWDDCLKDIVYEVNDMLDDAVLSEIGAELCCPVDHLLVTEMIEEDVVDGDMIGIPGFFMNVK